jgi:cell division protein FtsB
MGFRDFINKNVIDLGDQKQPIVVVPQKPKISAKSFINPGQQITPPQTMMADNSLMSPSNFGSQISSSVSNDDLDTARERIIKLLDSSNQPGIDFHEYIVAKNGMAMIPTESDRYKIAYNTLSPIGLSKEILNKSAVFYMGIIDIELSKFQDQFAKVNKSDVADKKAQIEAKQQQMVQLSEQINKLNEDIKTMSSEVAQSEQLLSSKSNAFVQAANEAKTSIQTELDKINQYIS